MLKINKGFYIKLEKVNFIICKKMKNPSGEMEMCTIISFEDGSHTDSWGEDIAQLTCDALES